MTILRPRDQFEAAMVLDRLRFAGFNARPDEDIMDEVITDILVGTLNPSKVRVIQVSGADYEKAREFLNSPLPE